MFGKITVSEEKGGLLLSDSTPGTELFSFRILLPKGSKANVKRERERSSQCNKKFVNQGRGGEVVSVIQDTSSTLYATMYVCTVPDGVFSSIALAAGMISCHKPPIQRL